MNEQWYNISPEETLQKLESKQHGLTAAETDSRLLSFGPNLLKRRKKTSPVMVFLQQFMSPLIYVLLVAVAISLAVGHYTDAYVILGVLLLNAVIGFVQETNAEKAMEALMKMAAPQARVRREGVLKMVPSREIVPGDILLLETGDKIPADARLLEVINRVHPYR
jgi:Ca2+-transporting ATPase